MRPLILVELTVKLNPWMLINHENQIARSPLYQHRSLQVNTHFTAFFKAYKIDIPLHRSVSDFCKEIDFPFFVKMNVYVLKFR